MAENEWRRLGMGDKPMKDIFSLIESQCVHYSSENGVFIIINASRPLSLKKALAERRLKRGRVARTKRTA